MSVRVTLLRIENNPREMAAADEQTWASCELPFVATRTLIHFGYNEHDKD